MADKSISELPIASSILDADKFLLEQSGKAKRLEGSILKSYAETAGRNAAGQLKQGDKGEPGTSIKSLSLVSGNHTPGQNDRYRLTMSDDTYFEFNVYNGANGTGAVNSVNGMVGNVVLDGKQSFADNRYFMGFLRGWHLIRHGDKLYQAMQTWKISGLEKDDTESASLTDRAKANWTMSKSLKLASDFPIGQLLSFNGIRNTNEDRCMRPNKNNAAEIGFRLLTPGAAFSSADNVNLRIEYAATRAVPPKTVSWHNTAINGTGNTYGKDAVAIANSYYEACRDGVRKFAYRDNWSYGKNTELNDGNEYKDDGTANPTYGYGLMQCDTLVLMVMLGIPYSHSPYYSETATDMTNIHFDQIDVTVNPTEDYWATNWMDMYDTDSGRVYNNAYGKSAISDTSEELWDFWRRGWCFSALDNGGNFDRSLVEDGDIVIFREPGADFFDGITHIAVCSQEDDGLCIYHVTSGSRLNGNSVVNGVQQVQDGKIAWRSTWDQYMAYHPNYTTDNFYFVRPKYADLQNGDT